MTFINRRHKKRLKVPFKAAVFLLLLPMLGACGMRSGVAYYGEPDELVAGEDQYVTLDLRIEVNPGGDNTTRAFQDSEDGTFEDAANLYEHVNTLRVVIVDENTVEHNRMVNVKSDYASSGVINSYYIINDNLRFKVKANKASSRKKKIYLFANEKTVNINKTDAEKFDFTDQLAVGSDVLTSGVEDILLVRKSGEPFIDNNDYYTSVGTYIPMSECFDVSIPAISNNSDEITEITETLFLTRSLIKFSFSVNLIAEDGNDTDNLKDLSALKLSGVKISNLANSCYYLPKDTEYDPTKDKESTNYLEGRTITKFTTPGITGEMDYPGSDCTFIFSDPLPLTINGKESEQYIYLPETKTNDGYNLSLLFENDADDNFYNEVFGAKPLQLNDVITKDIPRNTHVKVNIFVSVHDMSATVTLYPYTAVNLNPSFGF